MKITRTSPAKSGNNSSVALVESEDKPFFFYGHKTEKRKNKLITRRVAYAGIQSDNAIRLGKAVCSLKDSFVKKKARAIALGRAIKTPEDVLYLTGEDTPIKQFITKVASMLDPVPSKRTAEGLVALN